MKITELLKKHRWKGAEDTRLKSIFKGSYILNFNDYDSGIEERSVEIKPDGSVWSFTEHENIKIGNVKLTK